MIFLGWLNAVGRPEATSHTGVMSPPGVRVASVNEAPREGVRVLIDRLWPRGLSKERACLDEWCRSVAPSTELRRWYGHDPQRFDEFRARYRRELGDAEPGTTLDHLVELSRERELVLLTATRDLEISHAAVLADVIAERRRTLERRSGSERTLGQRRAQSG